MSGAFESLCVLSGRLRSAQAQRAVAGGGGASEKGGDKPAYRATGALTAGAGLRQGNGRDLRGEGGGGLWC